MTAQMNLIEPAAVPLRALSLTQPWASLVAIGAKRYETRSWSTSYRGPLAIAAAKKFPRECKELAYVNEPFSSTLYNGGYHCLRDLIDATGHIVAVVDLVGCISTRGFLPHVTGYPEPGEHERDFGDYSPGRFAWALANLRRLPTPIPAKGMLGVWEVPHDTALAVQEQLRAIAKGSE